MDDLRRPKTTKHIGCDEEMISLTNRKSRRLPRKPWKIKLQTKSSFRKRISVRVANSSLKGLPDKAFRRKMWHMYGNDSQALLRLNLIQKSAFRTSFGRLQQFEERSRVDTKKYTIHAIIWRLPIDWCITLEKRLNRDKGTITDLHKEDVNSSLSSTSVLKKALQSVPRT